MKIELLLFGIASDLMESSKKEMLIPDGMTISEFREYLQKEYAKLKHLSSYAVALNEAYAQGNEVIQEGDVIAIIPPVSGG